MHFFLALRENKPCMTPDGARGTCVQFKTCPSLVRIIQKDPLFEDDVAFLRGSQCDFDVQPLVSFKFENIYSSFRGSHKKYVFITK